jgi:hypothetical protein
MVEITNREITLPLGATAEPNTCGSCKFFDRVGTDYGASYQSMGRCRINLPPLNFVEKSWDGEGLGPRSLPDTERCDLQRPDGKVYIVQRRIPPLREG